MHDSMPLVVNFITEAAAASRKKDPRCLKCGHLDIEHHDSVKRQFVTAVNPGRICKYPASSDPNMFEGQSCVCGDLQMADISLARPFDPDFIRYAADAIKKPPA